MLRPLGMLCWIVGSSSSGARSTMPRVLVIGAGMAGLTAAHKLATEASGDLEVVVLEASERIGGRIHTWRRGKETTTAGETEPQVLEYGATWLHGRKGNPLYDYAKRMELATSMAYSDEESDGENEGDAEEGEDDADADVDDLTRALAQETYLSSQGETIDPSDVLLGLKRFGMYMRELEEDEQARMRECSVGAYMERRWEEDERKAASSPNARVVFDSRKRLECSINGCSDLNKLCSRRVLEYDELDGENVTVTDGLDRLLPMNESVTFASEVTQIRWGSSGVQATTSSGAIHEADFAIVTVSLGVLKANLPTLFEPPLPAEKVDAIAQVDIGVVDKIYVELDHHLRGQSYSVVFPRPDKPWQRSASIYTGHGKRLVSLWLVGEAALTMERLPEGEVASDVLDVLLTCDLVPRGTKVVRILRSQWGTDKNFLGSYSYPAATEAGSSCSPPHRDGEHLSPFESLRLPLVDPSDVPRVFFAGEATHSRFWSTMTGAYLTGIQAAEEVIEVSQKREFAKARDELICK